MAHKKDEGKSTALVLKSESPASPVFAIDLANRFAPFSSEYPISYSSTLATPYDPFADVSQKPRVPSTAYNKPSAYMFLPFSQHLFSIDLECSKAKSARDLALSYFPKGFHWIPEHPLKSLAFYSNILSQTKPIVIKPIFYQTSVPRKIIYSSVHFHKVIFEKEWGGHPSSLRTLEGFQIPFSYYDYVDA
jgi:hypothetical protein